MWLNQHSSRPLQKYRVRMLVGEVSFLVDQVDLAEPDQDGAASHPALAGVPLRSQQPFSPNETASPSLLDFSDGATRSFFVQASVIKRADAESAVAKSLLSLTKAKIKSLKVINDDTEILKVTKFHDAMIRSITGQPGHLYAGGGAFYRGFWLLPPPLRPRLRLSAFAGAAASAVVRFLSRAGV